MLIDPLPGRCSVLRYGELRWYTFGLLTGFRHLWANGASLGWKKTLGKILQPINVYTRFPEYQLFHAAIRSEIASRMNPPISVLDVGSPKLFGFYLASRYGLRAHLTDINERDIQEYSRMWSAQGHAAAGVAVIERQDARALTYADGTFDAVYSMSAIEHVEGQDADGFAILESWRVLKPAGLLVVSVPFGDRYIEQTMVGFSFTAPQVEGKKAYFFQRIYDKEAVNKRLLHWLNPPPSSTVVCTVYRTPTLDLATAFHKFRKLVGLNASGLIGVANPLLSALLNRDCQGFAHGFPVSYGPIHSLSDVYADVIIVSRKPHNHDRQGSVTETG